MTPEQRAKLARELYEQVNRSHTINRASFENIVADKIRMAEAYAREEQMERDVAVAEKWPERHHSLNGWMPDEAAGSIAIAIRAAYVSEYAAPPRGPKESE